MIRNPVPSIRAMPRSNGKDMAPISTEDFVHTIVGGLAFNLFGATSYPKTNVIKIIAKNASKISAAVSPNPFRTMGATFVPIAIRAILHNPRKVAAFGRPASKLATKKSTINATQRAT